MNYDSYLANLVEEHFGFECTPVRIDQYDEGLMNCHECDCTSCPHYYEYHDREHIMDDDFVEFMEVLNSRLVA